MSGWGRCCLVSVAEISQQGEEFERMPPHDVAAEQCVLGGMLLSKDAISDVIEVIRPADHYRPAHQIIHEAVLDLYARGEPAGHVIAEKSVKQKDGDDNDERPSGRAAQGLKQKQYDDGARNISRCRPRKDRVDEVRIMDGDVAGGEKAECSRDKVVPGHTLARHPPPSRKNDERERQRQA